jgi:phage terminase large subunit-like protein
MRMDAQTAPIEAGAVHLPRIAPWLDEFKKEVLSFPQGKHDDQIDALSQGLKRAFVPRPAGALQSHYGRAARHRHFGLAE